MEPDLAPMGALETRMSCYLFTIKKMARRTVRLPSGETVAVEHRLGFACAHAGSCREDDQRRVSRAKDSARKRMGDHFAGYVLLGEPENGTLIRWDAQPWWYDTDTFYGTKVGKTAPAPKGSGVKFAVVPGAEA